MSMIFCRGCGKSIHETALSCPHCGGLQAASAASVVSAQSPSIWMAVTSMLLGIFCALGALSETKWDENAIGGVFLFGLTGLIFGIVSLSNKMAGKGMAITGVALTSLALLIMFGNV
jgi:FtsH-binding integral membrane protein